MKTNQTQQNIPIGWAKVKFNKYIKLSYGSSLPDSKRMTGEFLVFGSNGVIGKHNQGIVPGPGIIIGRKGSIGEVTWSEKDFWPIDTTYFVEKDDSLDLQWLFYKLQTLGLQKMNSASGTPGLNREEVYKMEILIPTNEEQKKMAEILSTIDDEIQKTNQLISQTEKLKIGLMTELFTKGIGHTKFKKTKNGSVPYDWLVKSLSELAVITRGGSPRPIESYITEEADGLNWLKIGDIEQGAKYISSTSQKIKKEGLSRTTMVNSGDFILSNSMSFGRPYIMKISACIHDGWLAFKNIKTDLISKEFLYYLLSSNDIQNIFRSISAGSGVKNLKKETVSNVLVSLPLLEEQSRIVEVLSSVDKKLEVNKSLKVKLTLLKKGLMSDLLNGKVRVT